MPAKRISPAVLAARQRLRRRRRKAVLTIFLLLLVVLGGFSFFQSDFFLVEKVQITGLYKLTAEEVRQSSGLEKQVLIWRVQNREIESRIKQSLPRVYSVQLKKHLPDRILIQLVERKDAALLPRAEGGWIMVDQDGIPLELVDKYPGENLPIISGLEWKGDVELGAPLSLDGLDDAIQVVQAFAEQGANFISEIHVDQDFSITVFTQNGMPVFFGSDREWDLKVQALIGIMDDLRRRNAQARYVDLRSVYRPVLQEK